MKSQQKFVGSHAQRGAALLIAIFALLLVSVAAIALIVSSGTDSALASNYRTSTSAYYAAIAGIEEARGRLLPSNPNYLTLPASPMPLTQVVYIINPTGGETVAPNDTANPATYPDKEYKQEFGVDVSGRTVSIYSSVSPVGGLPPASYKWVRISAVTEQSLGDPQVPGSYVDVNGDNIMDTVTPLFYDPANAPTPGLITTFAPPATASQALEITSYAVLPNGSQSMAQYVVRPLVVFPGLTSQTFPAALTLAGNNVFYDGPGTTGFYIRGQDPGVVPDPGRSDQCPGGTSAMPAIGYTNNNTGTDTSFNTIKTNATPVANYQGPPINPGSPPTSPPTAATAPTSISYVSDQMNQNWLSPKGLDAVVQNITSGADVVLTGPTTPGSFPSGMSASSPMTIVVNGDLDMNGWHNTGYGLLLVTGTLHYDPDATWEGLVLVIGQGNFVSTRGGSGGIDGAVFIAKTRDSSGNLLASLGASSFSQTGPGSNVGRGINYNSCLARAAEGPITYKVIAFKEIPLAN
jgi:hypothetical protein